MLTLTETLTEFFSTATGRAIAKEAEQKQHEARTPLVAELEAHTKRRPEVRARHERRCAAAGTQLEAARAKFVEAEAKHRAARNEMLGELGEIDRQVGQLEAQLRHSASPAIAACLARVNQRFDAERHTIRRSEERPSASGEIHIATGRRVQEIWSNELAVQRLVAAINRARAELSALELAAPIDVAAELTAIEQRVDAAYDGVQQLERVGNRG